MLYYTCAKHASTTSTSTASHAIVVLVLVLVFILVLVLVDRLLLLEPLDDLVYTCVSKCVNISADEVVYS
jgi:hypothetical protein